MKNKIKVYYEGRREADGWGCNPVMTGYDVISGFCSQEDAEKEFKKMVKSCGEFASTLVNLGQKDYTFFNF